MGEAERYGRIVEEVADLYRWLDSHLEQAPDRAGRCKACGACCDFHAYDHRLFVTGPELIYLAAKLGTSALKEMPSGRCPYLQNDRCTVHPYRFAGCRIFCCRGDRDFQSDLTETVLRRLKRIGERFQLPYRYQDLAAALNCFAIDTCQSAETPCPADREG